MPLVLHGGSVAPGIRDIENCVQYGINKINVGCDFMNANVDKYQTSSLEKDPEHQLLGNDASGRKRQSARSLGITSNYQNHKGNPCKGKRSENLC